MSNTTDLSSYADSAKEICTASIETIASGIKKVDEVVKWLQEESQADEQGKRDLKKELRKERLIAARSTKSSTIRSVDLHIRNTDNLVRSAEKLGFKATINPDASKPVLLRNPIGERIAIMRNTTGALTLLTGERAGRIHSLVRQHTLDRTVDYLNKANMQYKTGRLSNGEVQILANEPNGVNHDGSAQLKVQVRNDGTAWVDVDTIKGKRCEKIVADLAQTIGAKTFRSMKKEAYYQLPGEPVKTGLRI